MNLNDGAMGIEEELRTNKINKAITNHYKLEKCDALFFFIFEFLKY